MAILLNVSETILFVDQLGSTAGNLVIFVLEIFKFGGQSSTFVAINGLRNAGGGGGGLKIVVKLVTKFVAN